MELVVHNLVSPIVLCFVLGLVARWVKSDFELPDAVYQGLSIYLLLAIGLKGGAAVSQDAGLPNSLRPAVGDAALGVLTPLSAFFLARHFGALEPDRCRGHRRPLRIGLGSDLLGGGRSGARLAGFEPEGYLAALVALLEVPGHHRRTGAGRASSGTGSLGRAVHDVLTGKSILLLVGGLVIGTACGAERSTRWPRSSLIPSRECSASSFSNSGRWRPAGCAI